MDCSPFFTVCENFARLAPTHLYCADGKPKNFKNSMREKMGEFLESFSHRNLFDNEKLAELVDQARDVVNGLSRDELRQDANLRKYIADEMNHPRIAVDGALEDLPRRMIRVAA
jgi:hypothetical protein